MIGDKTANTAPLAGPTWTPLVEDSSICYAYYYLVFLCDVPANLKVKLCSYSSFCSFCVTAGDRAQPNICRVDVKRVCIVTNKETALQGIERSLDYLKAKISSAIHVQLLQLLHGNQQQHPPPFWCVAPQ